MGILDYFGLMTKKDFQAQIETLKRQFEPFERWQLETAEAERFTLPDPSVWGNQAQLYRRLPAVFISVDIVASGAALTEFSVARVIAEKEPKDIPNHPFEMLLAQPNPLDSRYEFLYGTIAYWMLNKNAYWWLNRESELAAPDEIWVIPPHMIQPIPDERMFLRGYYYYPGNGAEIFLPPHEIIHFKGFNPFSRFVGLSAGIESLMLLAQSYLGMTSWNTKLYNKSNGRLPGILSFEQMIADPVWEKIKADTREAAENRDLLMLRGVGQGGAAWQQAAATAKDMDFYTGLDKIDKIIMDVLAPGAYTMLFENANEANSRTGRATLNELAIYPKHVVMGEKITAGILPAYGSEKARPLVGRFKDIRVTDRMTDLQEQERYEKTHTIAEIREEYYGDDPIGDERDELLPEQIKTFKSEAEQELELKKKKIDAQNSAARNNMPGQQMASAMNQAGKRSLKANDNSAMIALRIPDVIREEIKRRYSFVDQETLNDLHITLVYLGDGRTLDKSSVLRAVGDLGMYQSPIKGSLQGLARFVSGSETDPIVCTFDSPQMPKLYSILCDMLSSYHVPFHREYGFIPHMTLAYIPSSAKMPINTIEPIEINFSEVYFVDGETWLPISLLGNENTAIKTQGDGKREIIEELTRWERKAMRIGAVKASEESADGFMCLHIPSEMEKEIRTALLGCKTDTAAKMVFEKARVSLKPQVITTTTPPPTYNDDALIILAKSLDKFAESYKSQTPANIYLPAQTFNLPQMQHSTTVNLPNQDAPQTFVNITPQIEAAKAPDAHVTNIVNLPEQPAPIAEISAPVTINQTVEPGEAPSVTINQPAPEPPKRTRVSLAKKVKDTDGGENAGK